MKMTVKVARVSCGYLQQEVADFLDLSLTAYVRKENGKSRFYFDEITRISTLFGIPIQNFFDDQCLKKTRSIKRGHEDDRKRTS
ncbi:hypothetical protein CHI14_09625 [Paenibacillus sp. 7516]|nr:hypothetical protein CHI14_09625 [Paenibacillus sp. 7516]